MFRSTLFLSATVATLALAKTDLSGCTSTDIASPTGSSVVYVVPGTGEICQALQCGGGSTPASTGVPGCPLYAGTATYSPSFLNGAATSTAAAASSDDSSDDDSGPSPPSYGESSGPSEDDGPAPSPYGGAAPANPPGYVTPPPAAPPATSAPVITSSPAPPPVTSTPVPLAANATVIVNSTTKAEVLTTIISAANATFSTTASSPVAAVFTTAATVLFKNTTTANATALVPTQTVHPLASTGGTMKSASVWIGSAGLVALGAFVVGL